MTYSRAGEFSMKKRLESDLDFKQNKSSFDTDNVRTIHSFCHKYLKWPRGSIFLIKKTNDNDGVETLSVEGKIWKDQFIKHPEEFEFQKLSNDNESFEQLIDAVSAFKRENKTIDDLEKHLSEKASDDEFTIKLQDLLNYWKLYEKHLLTINKKDFDDLLKQTNEQFNENNFKKEFGTIKYLIIDEFQDTNYLQFEIIKKILSSKNITVVGDKNQSIYSFQGASTELYTDFAKNFKNHSTKQLMYNYRSSPQIVKTSNNFIQTFLEDHSTTVGGYKTQNSSLSPVHVREFSSNGLELEYIFKLIMSNINNEIPRRNAENKIVTFSDFVILTRTNEVRLELRRCLIRLGIPCESKRFTTIEYKEKLITKSLTKILDQNNLNQNSSISELINSLKKDKNLKYGNLQLDFEKNWSEIDESHMSKTILSLANEFHNVLGNRDISEFLLYFNNPNGESGEKRPKNWSSISNAVKIQTIHSVKGEEFPYVIIANSIEDHFPIDYFESELKVPVKLKESYSEEPSEKL